MNQNIYSTCTVYNSVVCVPGKTLNSTNQCDDCPKDTFKATIGDEDCTSCADNSITVEAGSKNASDCSE